MTTTLCIVLGFGKQQATFDRHLPLWTRHGFDMLIGCPSDDPLDGRGFPVRFTGQSSYAGDKSVERLKNVLRAVAGGGFLNAIIFEYDSICLIDKPEIKAGFHGIFEANEDRWNYVAPCYLNAPWTIDAESAWKMLETAESYPDLTEGGQDDRYLSALAWFSGVPLIGHKEGGFARNTIASADWPLMIDKVQQGAKWVHGIKTEDTLTLLRQAWQGA